MRLCDSRLRRRGGIASRTCRWRRLSRGRWEECRGWWRLGSGSRSNWLEVREHVLEFGYVGWYLIRTYLFEAAPQFEDGGIRVGAGDGFLRNPFEDLDDGSIG